MFDGDDGSGPSRTSTQTPRWSRLREWTQRRRLRGMLASAWLISTRPRWRRMVPTIAAFGGRWLGLMVTVVLFVLSSSRIFHQNPWYCKEAVTLILIKWVLIKRFLSSLCVVFLQGARVRVFMYPSNIWGAYSPFFFTSYHLHFKF
jgi:hypothetical protein